MPPRWLAPGIIVATALAGACTLTPNKHPPSDDLQGGDAGLDGGSVEEAEAALPRAIPKLHRATATPCTQPRSSNTGSALSGCPADGGCTSDQDCTNGPSGQCVCQYGAAPIYARQVCAYDECASDSDCTTNAVCICRETMLMAGVTGDPSWNTWCARAGNCRLDSDCGPGGYCSPSAQFQCSRMTYYYNYFCHTADDECVNDSDCPSQPTQSTLKPKADCAYNPAVGHWACSSADICSDG